MNGNPEERDVMQRVMQAARDASRMAYAPYSNFHVGAAILTEGGTVHPGCNVENASYGLGICAERNAAASMALADAGDREIRFVAVSSPNAAPCFPCGACRQVLREFGCKAVVVVEGGELRSYPFDEILPHSFGPEVL
jgi:cytidine deaminase